MMADNLFREPGCCHPNCGHVTQSPHYLRNVISAPCYAPPSYVIPTERSDEGSHCSKPAEHNGLI